MIRQHAAEIGLMSYPKDVPMERPTPNQSPTAPTFFVDYDGTLHIGHALIDASGLVTLDSGRPLFEYVPLLVEMLKPYPYQPRHEMKQFNRYSEWLLRFTSSQKNVDRVTILLGGTVSVLCIVLAVAFVIYMLLR
jgi:hypothetical protein